jgi:hypothetical protein
MAAPHSGPPAARPPPEVLACSHQHSSPAAAQAGRIRIRHPISSLAVTYVVVRRRAAPATPHSIVRQLDLKVMLASFLDYQTIVMPLQKSFVASLYDASLYT